VAAVLDWRQQMALWKEIEKKTPLRIQKTMKRAPFPERIPLANLFSRPRVSQIMRLTLLSPRVQEALLFLPRTLSDRDPIDLRQLLSVAAVLDWRQQMVLWKEIEEKTPSLALRMHHETRAFREGILLLNICSLARGEC
jgi:hypothetical protein